MVGKVDTSTGFDQEWIFKNPKVVNRATSSTSSKYSNQLFARFKTLYFNKCYDNYLPQS